MTDNHIAQPVSDATLRAFRMLADRDGGMRCAYCLLDLEPERLSRDHIVPRSRGGHRHPENLVLCCRPCNNAKGDRTPAEWRPGQVWAVPILNRRHVARLGPAQRNHKYSTDCTCVACAAVRRLDEQARPRPLPRSAPITYKAFADIRFCATCQKPVDVRVHSSSHLTLESAAHEPSVSVGAGSASDLEAWKAEQL